MVKITDHQVSKFVKEDFPVGTNRSKEDTIQLVNSVAVDTLIISVREKDSNNYRKLPEKKLCVLMERDLSKSNWQIPKTIKRQNENLEEAAFRKVTDMLGQDNFYIEQLYSFSDSTSGEDTSVNISYLILLPELSFNQVASDSSAQMQWFEIDYAFLDTKKLVNEGSKKELQELYQLGYEIALKSIKSPKEQAKGVVTLNLNLSVCEPARGFNVIKATNAGSMDFRILAYGLERLRNKVEYTDLIFYLMPKCFTLTELQQVQELILNEKIYAAHFRRKVEQKLIKCSDQASVAKGHRPAQQYTYNPCWRLKHGKGGL